MEVRPEIALRTGRDAAISAVYASLERLREKGYLRAHESDTESAARAAYRVTADDRRVLDHTLSAIAKMRESVETGDARGDGCAGGDCVLAEGYDVGDPAGVVFALF